MIKYLAGIVFCLVSLNSALAQTTAHEVSRIAHKIASYRTYLSTYPQYKGTFAYSNIMLNLAELYATINMKDSAFFFLQKAIDVCPPSVPDCAEVYSPDMLGSYPFRKWMNTREWKRFDSAITKVYMDNHRHLVNSKLALEILVASGYDQSVRFYARNLKTDKNAWNNVRITDSLNTKFIQKVIQQYGFPSISKFGKEASNAAFILAQHSNDLAFQKDVLKKMEVLMATNDIRKDNYAYLYDRIMAREKGQQLYGTQVNSSTGQLFPILDSMNVNYNRAKMGLGKLER